MATDTLTRLETDRLYSMRSKVNETAADTGDFWSPMKADASGVSDNVFNAWTDWYNGKEEYIETVGNTLNGTKPDTTTFAIASLPSRPRPTHRP